MIKIITKHIFTAVAMFAVVGAAQASSGSTPPLVSDIPDWTDVDGGVNGDGSIRSVTPGNILSTQGKFKYKEGSKASKINKFSYKAKSSKGPITLNDVGFLGNSITIQDAAIKVKGGEIVITGIDPFGATTGSKGSKFVLVTANYDEWAVSNDNFSFDFFANGADLFGITTTNIECPVWDFCTTSESFYVAGEFGDPNAGDRLKVATKGSLGGATAVTTIPVPAAVWLFGTGLLGLVGVARRKAS